jgi:(E)-4-hydroxy-3-methyl-but-2-enyl pyrophosphate reductase
VRINVARYGGFCFGVRRAITIALKTAVTDEQVCMLDDIVHNEDVIKQIEQAGIKRIRQLGKGNDKTLLLSAHGTGIAITQKAQRRGYKIVDATCPMVKGIHKIARKLEAEGYVIIIIGDHDHSEVQGIIGQLAHKPIVIDRLHNIPHRELRKIRRAAVVVQSTQNAENVFKIIDVIKQDIDDLKFFNTICRPTRIRQAEIRTMPLENDVMVVIGSRTSANTQRLCQISRALNDKTYCVQSKKELRPGWFKGARSVGVASGASTPVVTINEVVSYLKKLSK